MFIFTNIFFLTLCDATWKGKGIRHAILVLRNIMERAIENQRDLYMYFVDFEKAFDSVKHGP